MYKYWDRFFDYLNKGSAQSARAIVPLLLNELRPRSVLDVGCGEGAWLRAWQECGVADVQGLDGDYIDRERLQIARDRFVGADLSNPFDLGHRFELVQSLEVAEHLPAKSAEGFVRSLTAHGSIILFSAATPGQGGENHVNEQWPDYWRGIFHRNGFAIADFVRPRVIGNRSVESWYRYNTFLYVAANEIERLPPAIRETVIAPGVPLPSMSPYSFRLRSAALAKIPTPVVTRVARLKHKAVTALWTFKIGNTRHESASARKR